MPPNQEEAASGSRKSVLGFLKDSAHPTTCIFHLLFKVIGLLCYLLFGLFSSEKILCYIIVITMSAFDFWTVKNVSGR